MFTFCYVIGYLLQKIKDWQILMALLHTEREHTSGYIMTSTCEYIIDHLQSHLHVIRS